MNFLKASCIYQFKIFGTTFIMRYTYVCFLNCFILFKDLCICLQEWWERERQKEIERKRDSFPFVDSLLKWLKYQGWAGPERGAKNRIKISLGWQGPMYLAHPPPLFSAHYQGVACEAECLEFESAVCSTNPKLFSF